MRREIGQKMTIESTNGLSKGFPSKNLTAGRMQNPKLADPTKSQRAPTPIHMSQVQDGRVNIGNLMKRSWGDNIF